MHILLRRFITFRKAIILFIAVCLITLHLPQAVRSEQPTAEDAYMMGTSFQLSRNIEEAVRWYKVAAEQGHEMARFSLGDIYYRGDGIEQDYEEALKWFLLAADQGNISSQLSAGSMYAQGEGTSVNYAEAGRWFRRAAAQGSGYGEFNLGIAYDKGYGVPVDHKQAFSWFHKAAQKDIADAQFNVGIMYAGGTGVERDPVKAYRWIHRAAEKGHPQAIAARSELETILTPAQISLGRGQGRTSPPSGPQITIPDFKPIPPAPSDRYRNDK